MEKFIQVIVDGWATGSLYGALAVAIVLIYRATGIVNFAQGELAMFSTFIAWGLLQAARPRAAMIARAAASAGRMTFLLCRDNARAKLQFIASGRRRPPG